MASVPSSSLVHAQARPDAQAQAQAQAPRAGIEETRAPAPAGVVAALHDALIRAAAAAVDRAARFEQLAPVVNETHDLPYIAELTIRRRWRDLETNQREAFVEAFRELSIMTYAARFAEVGPNAFSIEATEHESAQQARVRAQIRPAEGAPVPLEYLLRKDADGAWRIVNILADGVSDLALKRAEYQRILASGTIDDLIADLREQARRLP
jgi:phospholipid transport system substrate-binding protein